MMASSWKKTITSPFRKACTFFNQKPRERDHHHHHHHHHHNKSQLLPPGAHEINGVMGLHGEVMACGYEDVQVMWSILDKSKTTTTATAAYTLTS